MDEITKKEIDALRTRIENAARRLSNVELDEVRKNFAEIEREAEEIDREVDRIIGSIQRGARQGRKRFRL